MFILFLAVTVSCTNQSRQTSVAIQGDQFYINGELTYKGRQWQGNKIEGLLFNSRMVQGIFDDLNPETRSRFKYPDTQVWDANRNTNEFVVAMKEWRDNGLLAFTLNMQGGSPLGYGNQGWVNSAFDKNGNLLPDYMDRLGRILNKADDLGMVVILGYFYFGQDQVLKNEEAVVNAVDKATQWILDRGYRNVLVEINNECNIQYDHEILQPHRVHELIDRVKNIKKDGYHLLVSTSYGGGTIPLPNVVKVADYLLLHGNGLKNSSRISKLVEDTRSVDGYKPTPIVFNEDDHFNFESDTSNFVTAVRSYSSWGYFDYRMKDEGFEEGYQSVPVDWGINSDRKKGFFKKCREIAVD
ncbi:MAG: hypothetical protein JJE09_15915 [Bacteroidia bacterium]|nr:hypothetical protein [Bacteroidia bacterium]